VQHLRTLVRNARKEQAEKKPPKAYREIFQLLKSLQGETQSPTESEHHDDEENP
jgi:ribosome-associated protein